MKAVTIRQLNRDTASIMDAVENGETFEVQRNGRAVGYLTQSAPKPERGPDWKSHFDAVRKSGSKGAALLGEFEESRRRLRAREKSAGNLQ